MESTEPSFVSVAGVEENSGELDSSDEDIELQRGVDEHFRFCVNKHSWPSPRVKHRTTSSLIAFLHCSCCSKRWFLFETYQNTTMKEPEHAIEKRCMESIFEHIFIVWALKWALNSNSREMLKALNLKISSIMWTGLVWPDLARPRLGLST